MHHTDLSGDIFIVKKRIPADKAAISAAFACIFAAAVGYATFFLSLSEKSKYESVAADLESKRAAIKLIDSEKSDPALAEKISELEKRLSSSRTALSYVKTEKSGTPDRIGEILKTLDENSSEKVRLVEFSFSSDGVSFAGKAENKESFDSWKKKISSSPAFSGMPVRTAKFDVGNDISFIVSSTATVAKETKK